MNLINEEHVAFAQRRPLPRRWAGLRDADLQAETGIADAVFAHRARFTAGARSREGILEMARLALEAADCDT